MKVKIGLRDIAISRAADILLRLKAAGLETTDTFNELGVIQGDITDPYSLHEFIRIAGVISALPVGKIEG